MFALLVYTEKKNNWQELDKEYKNNQDLFVVVLIGKGIFNTFK